MCSADKMKDKYDKYDKALTCHDSLRKSVAYLTLVCSRRWLLGGRARLPEHHEGLPAGKHS